MATVTHMRPRPPMRRGGFYWVPNGDGTAEPMVSVTNVLNEVAKQDFFVPAAIKKAHAAWSADPTLDVKQAQATWYQSADKAANKGSLLHSFYEAYGNGADLNPEQLPEEQRPHARAFVQWLADVRPEILHTEATVVNHEYRFAGTGDLWAVIGGRVAIVDYKTGFFDEFSTGMQEAAYKRGEYGINPGTFERFDLPKVEALYGLQTRPNGTYGFYPLADRWADFLAYLHIWRSRNDKPCPKACQCGGAA